MPGRSGRSRIPKPKDEDQRRDRNDKRCSRIDRSARNDRQRTPWLGLSAGRRSLHERLPTG